MIPNLRAVIVCVDYSDLLALTLPYNRHHFSDVMVVTSYNDVKTIDVLNGMNVLYYKTDAFYDDGAHFNKWKALEEGLDYFGRHGWLCLMDADILWPKNVEIQRIKEGKLYTPRRRMFPDIPSGVPDEGTWHRYPLHRNEGEFAGYSQIFHASDPVLGIPPWHEVNWKHAGGADSFFQRKWSYKDKIRPEFEVLHLGEAGVNWCGRSEESKRSLKAMMYQRRRTRRFDHEKL